MFRHFNVCLALVMASLAVIHSDPLIDIPRTSLDLTIGETPNNSRRVAIAIDRVDDLFGDNGELIAAKFSHVVLDFDISKNQIKLNNVPIEYGTSDIQIEAALAITPEALMIPPEQVLGAFDQGIIALQVTAIRDKVYSSALGRDVDRVILEEIITEINGCEVVQTNISQQIVDLDVDGNVTGYLPSLQGELTISQPNVPLMPEETDSSEYPCNFSSLRNRLHSWIHENPEAARASALVSLMLSGFLACFVVLPLLVYRRLRERNGLGYIHEEEYSRIVQYESELDDEKFDTSDDTNEEQQLMK
ncbi:hypothetical protein K7432_001755 [Basidiobolus ranarum]|uniref:Uncharacterized protein n=1 Tax=Basidiobolus ranarum TaxID=34480 RepID=A0ABR2X2L1_9FUNG